MDWRKLCDIVNNSIHTAELQTKREDVLLMKTTSALNALVEQSSQMSREKIKKSQHSEWSPNLILFFYILTGSYNSILKKYK